MVKKLKIDNVKLHQDRWLLGEDPLNGHYEIYNSDELRILNGSFQAGKKNGLVAEWYANGNIKSQEEYKHGKQDGLKKLWYENGELKLEGNLKLVNNKLEGEFTHWYDNGQIKYSGEYKNGERVLPHVNKRSLNSLDGKIFHDGVLFTGWVEDKFKNKNYPHPITKSFVQYKNGEKEGYSVMIVNTNIIEEGNHLKGNRHGRWQWRSWHKDNPLKIEGHYKNGIKYGEWKKWSEQGELLEQEHWENGKRVK